MRKFEVGDDKLVSFRVFAPLIQIRQQEDHVSVLGESPVREFVLKVLNDVIK